MAKGKKTETHVAAFSAATKLVVVAALAVMVIHTWGAVVPSHENWGVHLFAFFHPLVGYAAMLVMILVLFPSTQIKVFRVLELFVRACTKLPMIVLLILVTGIVIGSAMLFPVQLHLLGDGAILLRSIHVSEWGSDLAQSFRNQPLMRVLYGWTMSAQFSGRTLTTYDVYVSLDIIAAVLFVVMLFWFFRKLDMPVIEKVLLAGFLFFSAGSQFFFKYVENYVFQYITTVLFVLSGWLAMEKRVSIILPLVCFAVIASLHLGNFVFAPGVLFLVLWKYRTNMIRGGLIVAGIVVAISGVLFAVKFNLEDFLKHLASGSVDFLQPFTATDGNFPYAMFSWYHTLDWLNTSFLIAPFALCLAVILLVFHGKDIGWKNPALLFLLVTTGCGLLFTWIVNSALGMARDWDLFAGFFIPLIVLDVFLLSRSASISPRRYVLMVIVAGTIVHWAAWIGINASADRHLARIQMLNSSKFLSVSSHLVYDEALANFFFDTGKYREARKYYEDFVSIDKDNPRILGNLADTYRKMGEKEKYFSTLKIAVELQSHDPGVYSNLGVEYAARGDTMHAIEFNERAIAISPVQKFAHANLGILYTATKRYPLADTHFTAAIDLGMREPVLFRYLGDVCVFTEQYQRALQYYNTYLGMVPGDKKTESVRDQVRQRLQSPAAPNHP